MRRMITKADRLECRAAYVPKGAIKVMPKGLDAEFYLFDVAKVPCAMMFAGTAARPRWRYHFKSTDERANKIAGEILVLRNAVAIAADYKAKARTPHSFEAGHILVTCWGYEQTNREFFKVVEVKGPRTLVVRELEKIDASAANSAWMTGDCVPGEKFVGEPLTVRTRWGNSVSIEGHSASLWEGKPVHWTAYH